MELLLSFETWIVLAILLASAEIFVPGGILLNLGIASLIVAIGIKTALLTNGVAIFTTWFISATILLFVGYFVTNKFFPSKQRVDNTDEELDVFGQEVLVTHTIGPGHNKGRVDFQGTSWTALGDGSTIEQGSKATIICKENISLVVEPKNN
ncbi:NfeD family protein [Thalassotalea sp. LPB0316]|uniref:NfeD family protein n=1 Tax=Thalassotalea sp. LPB0316 TaxID=2769490 RepID=UPI0018694430|nr:NfeD family protein [Thalassotalea sp. LPB0316]QOL26003.1 NfeD family protein [Thalassotalea sp. LPB0316]